MNLFSTKADDRQMWMKCWFTIECFEGRVQAATQKIYLFII